MIRCIQLDNEVLAMSWQEKDGRVTLGDMRIVPMVVYTNIEKGFRYEEIH